LNSKIVEWLISKNKNIRAIREILKKLTADGKESPCIFVKIIFK